MCGIINRKVKGKAVKLLEGNKGSGKDYLGPKMINLKGKVEEFYYLTMLFHQMTPSEKKDKSQNERRSLPSICSSKKSYPSYINNYQSITGKQLHRELGRRLAWVFHESGYPNGR